MYMCECNTYPWIVERDPVLDSVAESFKAQVGKFIEIIDHAYILPSTIFLLQDLEKQRIREPSKDESCCNAKKRQSKA